MQDIGLASLVYLAPVGLDREQDGVFKTRHLTFFQDCAVLIPPHASPASPCVHEPLYSGRDTRRSLRTIRRGGPCTPSPIWDALPPTPRTRGWPAGAQGPPRALGASRRSPPQRAGTRQSIPPDPPSAVEHPREAGPAGSRRL